MLRSACQQFLGKKQEKIQRIALETLEGHQRAIMGNMTVEVALHLFSFHFDVMCVNITAFRWEILVFPFVSLFGRNVLHLVIFKNRKIHSKISLFVAHRVVLGTFYFYCLKSHFLVHAFTANENRTQK